MPPRPRGASLLFIWGLTVLLGGGALYNPGDSVGIAGGLRWLTLLVAVVLGGGLLWHGFRLQQADGAARRQNQRPALVLAVTGLLALVGSTLIFRPWAYEGLAGGIRTVGLAAFLGGSGLFILTGIYCYRTRNQRMPLTIFAGLTGAGVFYPVDSAGVMVGVHPVLWVTLVILFVGGPALTVYTRWPPVQEPGTATAG